MSQVVLYFKSHVKGYVKKDGTTVREHDDKRSIHELPSSAGAHDAKSADAYWRKHLAGKTIHFTSGGFPVSVTFDNTNTHMWTRAAEDGERPDAYDQPSKKIGARVFDPGRAVYMDMLSKTINKPWKVLGSDGRRDIYLGARIHDGRTYVVVLSVRGVGKCDFVSSHPKTKDEVDALTRRLRPVIPASHRGKKQKPLFKAASVPTRHDPRRIFGFIDVGGIHAHQGDSHRPSTPAIQAPVLDETILYETLALFKSIALSKSHVKGHTKKNGTVVKDYERGLYLLPKSPHPWTPSLFAHSKPKVIHPKVGEKGERVGIYSPHTATMPDTWEDSDAVATFTPGSAVPGEIAGITLAHWTDHPDTLEEWGNVEGQMPDMDEPPLQMKPGKQAASGVIIEDPDGRVWVISPTNKFGGYRNTFPKGKEEDELTLQANAIKEAFEESGLKVEITGLHGDFERTTSVTRYYTAKRVGGSPADMGWESQAVHLVPKHMLMLFLDTQNDRDVIAGS